jgi:hypothetical protein
VNDPTNRNESFNYLINQIFLNYLQQKILRTLKGSEDCTLIYFILPFFLVKGFSVVLRQVFWLPCPLTAFPSRYIGTVA